MSGLRIAEYLRDMGAKVAIGVSALDDWAEVVEETAKNTDRKNILFSELMFH